VGSNRLNLNKLYPIWEILILLGVFRLGLRGLTAGGESGEFLWYCTRELRLRSLAASGNLSRTHGINSVTGAGVLTCGKEDTVAPRCPLPHSAGSPAVPHDIL